MMIPLEAVQMGLVEFLDNDFMPQVYQKRKGVEGTLIGVGVALVVRNLPNIIGGYLQQHKALVDMMGITDGKGNYDIDAIAEVLRDKMGSEGMTFNIPSLGPVTFHAQDVERLMNYIPR